ncbi:MAG: hypothetical protein SVU88_03350, partial [Candidatus Nanohaloarchaea archaeon]|nr:hypothetical protein [Candidatus Nanohaloarchaea archaeon]
ELREDVDELKEQAGEEYASPEKLAELEEKVEELDDRLPSDELLESVEYVDEEFRGEVAELRERVETVQDALEEDVAA